LNPKISTVYHFLTASFDTQHFLTRFLKERIHSLDFFLFLASLLFSVKVFRYLSFSDMIFYLYFLYGMILLTRYLKGLFMRAHFLTFFSGFFFIFLWDFFLEKILQNAILQTALIVNIR